MRYKALLAILALITACSSGDPGVAHPTPKLPVDTVPTPPPSVPASLVIQAGDGQQAEPGSVLLIKPTVVVRSAAGQGVPGIVVSFVVDSGGGALQTATVSTAADGTASAGDWRLGSSEGRNVVSVSAAALTKVKLVATAAITAVTIPNQVVTSSGGTATLDRPGSSINGLTVVVPSGAFPVSQTIGISYASNTGFAIPARSRAISPVITFRMSDGRLAAKPMLITIPVTVPAGRFPQLLLRDVATGRQELLTTVNFTPTSVTAMTGHLNGARLMGNDGSFTRTNSALRSAARFDPASIGTVVVIDTPIDELELDHDTGFRPGVDSWEFATDETILADFTAPGLVATEAWYFIAKKRFNGNLWKKFQEADGIEDSNRRGLRWVSTADEEIYGRFIDELKALIEELKTSGVTRAELLQRLTTHSLNSVRNALMESPGEPQMVMLNNQDDAYEPLAVLVYRSTGKKLFAVDPVHPAQTLVLDFSSGSLAPLTIAGLASTPFTSMMAPGFSLLAAVDELATGWDEVVDGTIGDDVFPVYRKMVGWGTAAGESTELKGDIVYALADSANSPTVWIDCLTCLGLPRPVPFPVGTAKVGTLMVYSPGTGTTWISLGTAKAFGTRLSAPGDRRIGVTVLTLRPGDDQFYWNDWFALTLRRLPASIALSTQIGAPNADVGLTLSIAGAPGNLEYLWDFGDGTKATTATVATTHKWSSTSTYTTSVLARDKTTKQPVAKASVEVTIAVPMIAWRFTSVSLEFSKDGPDISSDARWRIDSTRLARMRDAGSQGGIRLVEQAFTPTGFPVRIAQEGLYLLEGASVTLSTLIDPATSNTFASTTFSGATLALAPAPRVSAWMVVRPVQIAPQPACADSRETLQRTGTATAGRLVGWTVHTCWPRGLSDFPWLSGLPTVSMETDVNFSGTAASGYITFTFWFYHNQATTIQRKTARFSFQGTRVLN